MQEGVPLGAMVIGGEEGGGWWWGVPDRKHSGYIMRPGSALLTLLLTPFVRTDAVPIMDVQRSAKLFLLLLYLVGLCWKRKFKVATGGPEWEGWFFLCDSRARLLIMCFGASSGRLFLLAWRSPRTHRLLPRVASLDKHRFCTSESIHQGDGGGGGSGVWLSPTVANLATMLLYLADCL